MRLLKKENLCLPYKGDDRDKERQRGHILELTVEAVLLRWTPPWSPK
jgi:hypothetical protein